MTPAERDAARRWARWYTAPKPRAADDRAAPPMVLRDLARAVLAFVPPGDAQAPAHMRVFYDGQIKIYDHRARRGPTLTLDDADAERLAWALLAAVAQSRAIHAPEEPPR